MTTSLLEIKNLTRTYQIGGRLGTKKAVVHALTDVSLSLTVGETLAVVGESGCGKSTLARTVAGLIPPDSGSVLLNGQSMQSLLENDPNAYRRRVQMVFQDPYSSVNPRRRIGATIGDGLRLRQTLPKDQRESTVIDLLRNVGLSEDYASRFPHELSGGQRQRVAIARALAAEPELVICDEPVSALDVSVQAQVMNLLIALQKSRGVAYLFISHNLDLVQHIAHRTAVMYLGEVVEIGSRQALGRGLAHPYSRVLFDAVPRIGAPRKARIDIKEENIPSPVNLPNHCRFASRCAYVQPRCREERPALRPVEDRLVRCHRAEEIWLPSAIKIAVRSASTVSLPSPVVQGV